MSHTTRTPPSHALTETQIITRGRYAGKKCVIINPLDNGTKSHPFPHALVAGIERYPSKVTRRMSKNKQAKKSKVKPFIKQVNCTWKLGQSGQMCWNERLTWARHAPYAHPIHH
jgi:hypothetical protein